MSNLSHWRNTQEPPTPPDEKAELKALIALLESSNADTSKMLNLLIEAIKVVGAKPDIKLPEPKVSVNMDIERLIKAMPKIPEAKAPVVNMDMDNLTKALTTEKPDPSYTFDIERDGHGRIKRVTANPIGVNP
jgi:hypothetical protein